MDRWIAAISVRGSFVYLGHFLDGDEAAAAYDAALVALHGKEAPGRNFQHEVTLSSRKLAEALARTENAVRRATHSTRRGAAAVSREEVLARMDRAAEAEDGAV